jgi:hypothetical protein
MKRFQLVVFIGLFSLALAQKQITFRDSVKNPHIIVQGNQGFLVPNEGFELAGNVQIKRIEDGGTGKVETLMTCAKATGTFNKKTGKTEVDNLKMTGGIQFTQTGKKGSTSATGDSAEYDLKDGLRIININGDVKVSFEGDSEKKTDKKTVEKIHSTMSTSSQAATLTFRSKKDANGKEISEVQSAIIRGPIQFNGTQLAGEKLQRVSAKADKMTYTILGESKAPEVRLEGNLEFRELDGEDGAVIEGATLLILQLNDKNEIVKLQFRSDKINPVRTTITKVDAGKRKGGA